MPSIPHRIHSEMSEAEKWALANDNWDKTVSDVSDLGARFSSVFRYAVTLAASGVHTQYVGVTDSRPSVIAGKLQIVPRLEVFVDNDLDDNYLAHLGGSLSASQSKIIYFPTIVRRPTTGTVAGFLVTLNNWSPDSHDYYVYGDESYMDSPSTGIFR